MTKQGYYLVWMPFLIQERTMLFLQTIIFLNRILIVLMENLCPAKFSMEELKLRGLNTTINKCCYPKLAFSSFKKDLIFSNDWIIANFSSAFLLFFKNSLAPSMVNLRRRRRS